MYETDIQNPTDMLAFKNVIQKIAREEIKKSGFPTYKAAIVRVINDDGTVDVYLPPNQDNLVTNVLNKCGELLQVGDSVEIATKNGSLTNSWIAFKHGTNVQGQAREIQKLGGEVVMKVENGRLSVTELKKDSSLGNAFTIIADDINLDGMNIVLNGSRGITISSPYFSVTSQGVITATSGTIGGWNMGATKLYSGSGANYIALDSGTSGQNYAIWAGNKTASNAPFSVTRAGAIKSTSGTIGGWTIDSNSLHTSNNALYLGTSGITTTIGGTSRNNIIFKAGNNFGVNTSGNLYANSANVSGTITATSGTIGGCSITDGTLQIANANIDSLSVNKITTGTNNNALTFSNITATGGTIGGCSITNGSLQVDNAHITSLNASKINAGTISADRIGANSITAGKLNVTNLSAISSNLGTITGGSININNYFSVNTSGGTQMSTSGGGFLTTRTTTHPYASALNLTVGSTRGVNFYSGTTQDDVGSHMGRIMMNDNNALHIQSDGTINLNNGVSSSARAVGICNMSIQDNQLWGSSSSRMTISSHITLNASSGGGYVYASGSGVSNSKVKTNNGEASSRNTKTNIIKFSKENYDRAINLLKNIDIYEYDYKYDLYQKRHQYGFIIDEIEKQDNYEEFFDFTKEKAKVFDEHLDFSLEEGDDQDKIITVKQYDSNVLTKYLLTCIKALQFKIEELEKKINKNEEEVNYGEANN